MTVTTARALPAPDEVCEPSSSRISEVRSVYRVERRKLLAQLPARLLAAVCVLGPFVFAGVLKVQSGVPADTLLGVWVHSSGSAFSLVVLGFTGSWGFPVIAGVRAGDLFSSEARHGTWKTVLTRSCRRDQVLAGKVLAAVAFSAGLVGLTAISSLAAGTLESGAWSLVNLSGTLFSPGHAIALVAASWLASLLPMLAFTSLSILFSVLQQRRLGRDVPRWSRLNVLPSCRRRAGASPGPGDDWACTLDVLIPQPGANPYQDTPVTYDVSVKSNGCYKAEAPPSFVGQQMMRDRDGHSIVNPLFTIYGCFDTL